jgi:hypothetical protein
MEPEERAGLTDGSESSDIERGTIPGTARRDFHSTQSAAVWGGESLSNPRRRGIQAKTIKETRDGESSLAQFTMRTVTFSNFLCGYWDHATKFGTLHGSSRE